MSYGLKRIDDDGEFVDLEDRIEDIMDVYHTHIRIYH
jgi:hypothetical protein